MVSLVQVDWRNNQVFVIPYFRSVDGIYVQKPPIMQALASDVDTIGRLVLEALGQFETGLPTPDWKSYGNPVYQAENVANWSSYVAGLRACHVEKHDNCIIVFPLKKSGKALVGVEAESVSLSVAPNASELSKAVLSALLGREKTAM